MAQDSSTDPKTPADDSPGSNPSALPEFVGERAPSTSSGTGGAPASLRVLLMAIAVLAVGYFLYREVAVDKAAQDGGGDSATEYAWRVVSPEGVPVDLSSYKGRPVLLNVWATWCGPCLMEMPSLAALSRREELKRAGVAVVLVSTDYDLEPVRGFLGRFDTGAADVLVAAEGPPTEFRTAGIPATFLIAPDGRIVRKEVGAIDWDTPEIAAELAALADRR